MTHPELLERYREQVKNGLWLNHGNDPEVHCALGIVAEAGEVADHYKKAQYVGAPPINQTKLVLELGDVLWYLTALADLRGLSLTDLAIININKLEDRHGSDRYSVAKLLAE